MLIVGGMLDACGLMSYLLMRMYRLKYLVNCVKSNWRDISHHETYQEGIGR